MSLNKEEILAQNIGRQRKSRAALWLAPLAMLPLFGVVAAFGFAPGTQPEHIDIRHVVEQITLPLPSVMNDNRDKIIRVCLERYYKKIG